MTSAAELAGRFGLRRHGREYRGTCPACGYKNAFSIEDRGGKTVWWCAACGDQAALTAIITGAAAAASPRDAAPAEDNGDRRAAALALWERARPDALITTYLAARGIRHVPPDAPLRLLADAKHPSGRRLPAMLALLLDDTGQPVAIHRTFLAPGGTGKADVEPVRMTLGAVRGAAVRLYAAAEKLVIAEGIETALAAAIVLDLPAWAAVSAGNLAETLIVPREIREVLIAADHDDPGRCAARAAASRWRAEGRLVRIAMPDRPGADFNDVLKNRKSPDAT